jgi:hypothetical protein
MKKMPELIKKKLRRLQKLNKEAQDLDLEIEKLFDSYGIDTDTLCACYADEKIVQTEGLAFIVNAEGDVEENINEIEKVFLYYVNSK